MLENSVKYHKQCIDLTNEYKKSATQALTDTEHLAENGAEICQNAIEAKNKAMELKKEIMGIRAIINKESSG